MSKCKTATQLPDDIDALKALVLERDATITYREVMITERDAVITSRDATIAHLEHKVELLTRELFAPSSEKRTGSRESDDHPMQGHFLFPELLAAAQRVADEQGVHGSIELRSTGRGSSRKKKGRRKKFPDHLPRVRTVYKLPETARQCCGQSMAAMGEEVRQELERIEVTLVHEIVRTKYVCKSCKQHLVTTPGPEQVIDKGLLSTNFLAHVISEHFCQHMPYYRLEQKYAGEGLALSRSVLCNSTHRCAELLKPIVDQMKKEVLAQDVIHTDDTPITIQKHNNSGRKTGRAWIYLDKKDRHVYEMTEDRSQAGPISVLKDHRGFIQADAFPVYDIFFGPGGATEVGCWAHTRRYFIEAEGTEPELAAEAVERIRELYAVERQAKREGLDEQGVRDLRQRLAVPMLDSLRDWLAVTATQVLDKGPMGKAISYTQNLWKALTVYTENGRLSIDNNAAERAIRPLAVGRKNWLFVNNLEAGQRAMVLYSLVQTARAIGLPVKDYLADVLQRISTCTDITKLTPHGWKQHFAGEVAARRAVALSALAGVQIDLDKPSDD